MEAKKFSRTVVGVDYLLDEVLNHKKEGPAKISQHASDIEVVLRSKKCEVPEYCRRLLAAMQAKEAHSEL